jgi:hypothetical protein
MYCWTTVCISAGLSLASSAGRSCINNMNFAIVLPRISERESARL